VAEIVYGVLVFVADGVQYVCELVTQDSLYDMLLILTDVNLHTSDYGLSENESDENLLIMF
jgi:hypothetical protein